MVTRVIIFCTIINVNHSIQHTLIIAQLNLRNHYVLKNVAPESEDYIVEQVHFHWGHSNDNKTGSEHLLEGKSFPLEVIINHST